MELADDVMVIDHRVSDRGKPYRNGEILHDLAVPHTKLGIFIPNISKFGYFGSLKPNFYRASVCWRAILV